MTSADTLPWINARANRAGYLSNGISGFRQWRQRRKKSRRIVPAETLKKSSSGNSGKSVRYTLSPPSQSAAFKIVPASPAVAKRANLERRRLGWLLVSVGRLGRMAAFVSRKNNRWLSLHDFLGRPDKATFPSRPTILKPLSVTAAKGGRCPSSGLTVISHRRARIAPPSAAPEKQVSSTTVMDLAGTLPRLA